MGAQVDAAVAGIKKFGFSIETTRAQIKSLKGELAGMDAQMLKSVGGRALTKELRLAQVELKGLEKQAAITGVTTGNALTKGFGALRGLANILPGIGMAGLFGLAFAGVEQLFGGISKKAKETEEAIKKLSSEFAGQAVKLTTLVGIVQNVNSKYDDKVKALKALNQEFGAYAKNLGFEEITLGNIAKAYDRIIDSLLRQAVVKGLQDEITKAVEKTAKGVIALQLAEEKRNAASQNFVEKEKTRVTVSQDVLKNSQSLTKAVNDGYLGQLRANTETGKGVAFVGDYSTRLARMKQELMASLAPLLKLTTSFSDLGIILDKTGAGKTPLDFGIQQTPVIKMDKISLDFSELRPDGRNKDEVQKALTDLFKAVPPIVVDPLIDLRTEKIRVAIEAQLKGVMTEAFATIGAGIGTALAGGDLKNVFSGFINVLADGFGAIGRQMVAAAPIIAALKLALKTLNPAILLPAGIALIAIGAALRATVGKGIPGRALGGPVGANSPYMVGERGPELFVPSTSGRIIPNNLSGISGQARNNITLGGYVEIDGRKLKLILARQDGYDNRNV